MTTRPFSRRTRRRSCSRIGSASPRRSSASTSPPAASRFFIKSFAEGRKALFMLKPDLDMPDDAVTVDGVKRALVIAGSPRRVLDQLVALRDEIGHFGTLLAAGHDWDQPKLWRRSMDLLATDVVPRLAAHAAATEP